ncbi:hypothetical protein BCR36DRAFT_21799 [Piromyces finnis]|uniref:C-CAP/cofactor C-like domain-containing protein n=1 Tax=Piromyces finnis TaxID=1754191 RepID=A0A1Y1VE74_9FUNG|nr:hypothetical protein BCR36DRAFT_21799 [Piromyces finnis]|eukprot:ORX53858.1 hypothetical protein BCR36DRAFT_21799 [Piromyces finnis]
MILILHPLLRNFIQLPLLPNYNKNPNLFYDALINLSTRLSNFSTGQLANCEREVWKELANQYLDMDYYQSNVYYDTWSSIAKLVVQNKNLEELNAQIKKSKSLNSRSNSTLNTSSSDSSHKKNKGKSKKKLSPQTSVELLVNMNDETVEFDRSNYIWGWPFFITFLFYQLIQIKEENKSEIEDLYIEIHDNIEDPHFDYNDNLFFWIRNLNKYLYLMNCLLDKSNHDEEKYNYMNENGQLSDYFENRVPSTVISSTNCKIIDLIFCKVKECKNTIIYNGTENDSLQDENDPIDYSRYGKLEEFLPCYNTSLASLAMIQNITKIKGKSFDYLKIKDVNQWIFDKLVNTTQQLNNLYDKLDPFKPTPLISIKLLPIVELICSEGGVIRGTFPPAFYLKESLKHNINRHVILKNQSKKFIYIPKEYIENTHLHLQNISYCEIYILTTVKSITITNCHHCKCIFGCISSRLTLNTVQDIKFSACTEQATFERCQNITAYLYIKKPSLLIGKCIHSLFFAPINSWYKSINKNIKQAQIQLTNGQKNNWNNLRLVWFSQSDFEKALHEQYENLQITRNGGDDNNNETMNNQKSKDTSQDSEINIYHKLSKVLNLKKSNLSLQEKIQKLFLLPSEQYELFVIPIFSKKKKSKSKLNIKTYSIDNIQNLEYDENYQHSSTLDISKSNKKSSGGSSSGGGGSKKEKSTTKLKNTSGSKKSLASKTSEKSSKSKSKKGSNECLNYESDEVDSVYSKNVLNKLPTDYYKSVMHKHNGHCIVQRILSDKNLIYNDNDNILNDNNNYHNTENNEPSTEKRVESTKDDINEIVRNDFYKWLKDTNNIEQVQRLLNYKNESK